MTDKAISSFVAMLRFNRKHLNIKSSLELEVLSISYQVRNNYLSIDDEWKLGYYLPKEAFLKLESWVALRMFKI